ncbi:hypothetical protein CRE_05059 [Caenorhabditis remanei]|uniref:Uncharacterized protein n=1 Tax=Caenorhabditis remanei TaxID=31234 RepID=E3MZ02_CAERE|nr:hypothetical protein CRE_05059 [Caenorhabditis remanei]
MSYDIRHNQTVRGWSYPPFYRTRYANVSGNYTTRNGTYENSYKINSNSTTRNYHRAHNNTPKWTPMYPRFNRTIFMRESWTYTNATTRRSRFTPFYNSSRRNISEFEYDTKIRNHSGIHQNLTSRNQSYPRFYRTTVRYDHRHNQTTRGRSYPSWNRTSPVNASDTGNYTVRNGTHGNNSRIFEKIDSLPPYGDRLNSNATTRNYYRIYNNTPKWTPMYPRFNRTIFMNDSKNHNNATTRRWRFTPLYNNNRRNISEFENDTSIRNHSGIHQNLASRNHSYPRFYRTTVRYDHNHNQTTRGRSYPSFNGTRPENVSDTGNYSVRNGTYGINSRIFEKIDSLPPYGDRLNSNATTRNYYRTYNNTPKWTPMYSKFNRTIFMNDSRNHDNATTRRWRFTPLYNNNRRNISEFENNTSIRNHSGIHQNLTSRNQSYPRFNRTTVRNDHNHNQTTRGRSYPSFNGTRPENVSDTGNYTIQKGIRGNNSKIFETIDYFPPYGDRLNSNTMTRNYYRTRNNTPKWTPMYPKFNRTIFMNDSKNHNNATTRRWRYTPFYHNTPKNASGNGNGTNGSDFKNYHRATHGHYLHKLYHNSTDRKVSKSRPTRASPHHKA